MNQQRSLFQTLKCYDPINTFHIFQLLPFCSLTLHLNSILSIGLTCQFMSVPQGKLNKPVCSWYFTTIIEGDKRSLDENGICSSSSGLGLWGQGPTMLAYVLEQSSHSNLGKLLRLNSKLVRIMKFQTESNKCWPNSVERGTLTSC